MASEQKNDKSYAKIAQFYNCFNKQYPASCLVKSILAKTGDINYQIPLTSRKRKLRGCTLLHIAARKNNAEITEILLKKGANIEIKNKKGKTALLVAVNQHYPARKLIDVLLSNHLLHYKHTNARDDFTGLSHFHIACMYGRLDVVTHFIRCHITTTHAVKSDSKKFAGFTGLHFAAASMAMPVIEKLVEVRVNVHLKDARGLTALHVFLIEKMNIYGELHNIDQEIELIKSMDKSTNLLQGINYKEEYGLTKFHIACTLRDTSLAEQFLNNGVNIHQSVNMDSPICPGYTPLHFAMHCNFNIAIMLMNRGAKIDAEDARGQTPMNLVWTKCNRVDLLKLLLENWRRVSFDNENVRVLEFIRITRETGILKNIQNVNDLQRLITSVPECWPGATVLHFSLMLHESLDVVKTCIENLDIASLINVQDCSGSTPIHLAYRTGRFDVIRILMQYQYENMNYIDEFGLSYLHIACAIEDYYWVQEICSRQNHINGLYKGDQTMFMLIPGSTALHVAMATGNSRIISKLLECGLILDEKDAYGKTALDRLHRLGHKVEDVCTALLPSMPFILTHRMIENMGMTCLHMAIFGNMKPINRYIDKKNIEKVIECEDPSSFLYYYNGCTALHVAIKGGYSNDTIDRLLESGADIFAVNPHDGSIPFYEALSRRNGIQPIINKLQRNLDLPSQVEQMSGITMLHITCHLYDLPAIDWLLTQNVDVHARVRSDCPLWAGCTPLHLLIKAVNYEQVDDYFYKILNMLLLAGADVACLNELNETPIHLVLKKISDRSQAADKVLVILLNNLHVFDENPADKTGMTHFHAACLTNQVHVVSAFLNNGVDVNSPIDFFADKYAGETALHLAVDNWDKVTNDNYIMKKIIVSLLLSHGANTNAEDHFGQTVLHKAVQLKDGFEILDMLVKHGVEMNARNIFAQTALELLVKSRYVTLEKLRLFKRFGCRMNSSNPLSDEGYISMLISDEYRKNDGWILSNSDAELASNDVPITDRIARCFTYMITAEDPYTTDEFGRSLFHNAVTVKTLYSEGFSYHDLMLMRFPATVIDIDLQDKKGRTALHLATKFENKTAIEEFLDWGSDINVVDQTNRTAMNYALESYENNFEGSMLQMMILHMSRLEMFDLELSENNLNLIEYTFSRYFPDEDMELHDFQVEADFDAYMIVRSMIVEEQLSLTINDFILDSGRGLKLYPFLPENKRVNIDQFFNQYSFGTRSVCMLQYRKVVKRKALLNSAVDVIWKYSGMNVPIICVDMILLHLTNGELTNLIKSIEIDNLDEPEIIDQV